MIGIIIWGSKGVERKVGEGHFFCPTCQHDVPYIRKKVSRFFTLYFIPIFPLETVGEYVLCQECSSDWDPEVLDMSRQEIQQATSPWKCRKCGNRNPPEYGECLSCNTPRG
jgi:hypothetical protein